MKVLLLSDNSRIYMVLKFVFIFLLFYGKEEMLLKIFKISKIYIYGIITD